jgi:hypothetical protein
VNFKKDLMKPPRASSGLTVKHDSTTKISYDVEM